MDNNRMRRRCIESGRYRGVRKRLKISRIRIREKGIRGEIKGMKKRGR